MNIFTGENAATMQSAMRMAHKLVTIRNELMEFYVENYAKKITKIPSPEQMEEIRKEISKTAYSHYPAPLQSASYLVVERIVASVYLAFVKSVMARIGDIPDYEDEE